MGRRGRILYRGGHRRGGGRRGAELLLYCCGHGDEEVELGIEVHWGGATSPAAELQRGEVVGGYMVEAERNFGLGARASGTRRRESAGWVEKDREGIPRGFGRVAAEGTGGWDKAPRI